MYLRSLTLTNIRAIETFELTFKEGQQAGWHVLLGANGAGKSSVIRSLALVLAGPKEAAALRQPWGTWVRTGTDTGRIDAKVDFDASDTFTGTGRRTPNVDLSLEFVRLETDKSSHHWDLRGPTGAKGTEYRTVWGTNSGWFAASFGPFRRFTGGDKDYDRLFLSNPRLAPHLSAFGEDVALTEGLRWLRDLRVKQLESPGTGQHLLEKLVNFLNNSELLPHGAQIKGVTSGEVRAVDGAGAEIAVEQLSDGYRSVLSMIFEILRQMDRAYGSDTFLKGLNSEKGFVELPGIIAIDEVDAHLHPSWQSEIGPWFVRCFPKVQFIVTTHSPIVCRAASTIWRLAAPGSADVSGPVPRSDFDRLTKGTIIDAYGTELFGHNVAASPNSEAMKSEIARLNRKALRGHLSEDERRKLHDLQVALPSSAATLADSD